MGEGLMLNISRDDNAQSLDLALSVIPFFRISPARAKKIISEVLKSVKIWLPSAQKLKLPDQEIRRMTPAFRIAG